MQEHIVHFWEVLATTFFGVIVTMIGSWLFIGKNMISKAEVIEIIQTNSPYTRDRQFIMERLAINKETQAALSTTLQKNIEVMNELKIQIATLAKTLEALEERIDRRV